VADELIEPDPVGALVLAGDDALDVLVVATISSLFFLASSLFFLASSTACWATSAASAILSPLCFSGSLGWPSDWVFMPKPKETMPAPSRMAAAAATDHGFLARIMRSN